PFKFGEIMETVTLNKTQDEKSKIQCLVCKHPTNHIVVLSADIDGQENYSESDWIYWDAHYQIVKCLGCDSFSFRKTDSNSEDYQQVGEDEWDNPVNEYLYPKRDINTLPTKNFLNTPSVIRRIYNEVISCYNNESYTLCGAGLRAIIDGLCAVNGVTDGPVIKTNPDGTTQTTRKSNLEGQISGLHEKGLLTEAHSSILHEHRFMGNKAVHELDMPSLEELKIAIDIVEHTLENIYELPEKASELRARKRMRTGV
ncbi:DUF4145 domain-containing protein, partial [Vibrio cholerae]